jgi:hypothetical protein
MRALAISLLFVLLSFNVFSQTKRMETSTGTVWIASSPIDKKFETLWNTYRTNNPAAVSHYSQAVKLSAQIEKLSEQIKTMDEEQRAKAQASGTKIQTLNSTPLRQKRQTLESELSKVQGNLDVIKLDYKKKVMPILQAQGK